MPVAQRTTCVIYVLIGISCALFTDNGTIDEAVAGMRGLLIEQLTPISSLSCLKSIERKNATHVGTIHLDALRCYPPHGENFHQV